ncbi:Asp-tRNA(Asn)/Glu-tRNA(Gln) amidotransferase subunit GatB [Chlamydiia bacterium]|nr:Asp-tRNA(Asn)/Glu-tRNA(Gln) amidotransferase subunit GatB [Chlamydiia bacterium]
MNTQWEVVIGLEVHVQLNTTSKLFCSAPNESNAEPNENINVTSLGLPGSLPIINQEAVNHAVTLGCAINAEIQNKSFFDRKSYFYPDSPRNFQITQLHHPILVGGEIKAPVNGVMKTFQIDRAHLEDDAGMLKHFQSFSGVDYNRAGIPLLEIVSEPCFRSSVEVRAYLETLREMLQFSGVSLANMESGHMRADVNISIRKKGDTHLNNKIEIKNVNSISNIELAINQEIKRQVKLITSNPDRSHNDLILDCTYRWDAETEKLVLMRKKEKATEYRYFPEPDLSAPLYVSDEHIDIIRKQLPELPEQKRQRYRSVYKLPEDDISTVMVTKKSADFFDACVLICNNPQKVFNWMFSEFNGRLTERQITIDQSGIAPKSLAQLVMYIDDGSITGKIAKKIADIMVESPESLPEDIIKQHPEFVPINNVAELEAIIQKVLDNNKQAVIDYQGGKQQSFGFLIGQIMKETRGQANPKSVNELLRAKLA